MKLPFPFGTWSSVYCGIRTPPQKGSSAGLTFQARVAWPSPASASGSPRRKRRSAELDWASRPGGTHGLIVIRPIRIL